MEAALSFIQIDFNKINLNKKYLAHIISCAKYAQAKVRKTCGFPDSLRSAVFIISENPSYPST